MTDFIQVFEGDGKDHQWDYFLYGNGKQEYVGGDGFESGWEDGSGSGSESDFMGDGLGTGGDMIGANEVEKTFLHGNGIGFSKFCDDSHLDNPGQQE